jgi:1D-myo-inositol-triphosphate 3-kinase
MGTVQSRETKKEALSTKCHTDGEERTTKSRCWSLPLRQKHGTTKGHYAPTLNSEGSTEKTSVATASTEPSLATAVVAGSWKHSSVKKDPWDGAYGSPASIVVRGPTASEDSITTIDDGSLSEYHLSDLSNEVLQQIIRCFPFPSPKSSPKTNEKKMVGRSISQNINETDGVQPRRHPTEHNATAWSFTKRHLTGLFHHRHNASQGSIKQDASHLKTSSANSSSTPSIVNSIEHENTKKGALGKLCQVSVDTMAITALPLDCWLKERLKNWVQLSGHEGTIIPASNHTLWKKQPNGNLNEAIAYSKITNDIALRGLTPKFYKEITHKNESFIEIQDLLSHFPNTYARAVMDIKIGSRTFLESEVTNATKRRDLYQKMVEIDPSEPTDEEKTEEAITKLRYMQFRERESSTASLGFRIEAAQLPEGKLRKSFKKVRHNNEVLETLLSFLGDRSAERRYQLCCRLKEIRDGIERSDFFKTHEVVGSSLLVIYDDVRISAWMIDFAKTTRIPNGMQLDHRTPWELGNHEDGYLSGLDNLIDILDTA